MSIRKRKGDGMGYSAQQKKEMGQHLKRLVKANSMSHTEFAKALGVIDDTVMKWYAGHNLGYLKRLKEICALLDTTPAEIYGRNTDGPQKIEKNS